MYPTVLNIILFSYAIDLNISRFVAVSPFVCENTPENTEKNLSGSILLTGTHKALRVESPINEIWVIFPQSAMCFLMPPQLSQFTRLLQIRHIIMSQDLYVRCRLLRIISPGRDSERSFGG